MIRYVAVFLAAVTVVLSAPAQDGVTQDSLFLTFPAPAFRSDSLVNVIVEFVEQPMFLAMQSGFVAATSYLSRFDEFAADLGNILPTPPGIASVGGRRQFHRTFFGAAVRIPRGALGAVQDLPYVRRIHEDLTVSADLTKSVAQIRANMVWSTFGTQGEGVRVGVIDSGIDYLHPALGGGFGPTFKVAGGYDFVNEDDDPMDDQGHGTHVAGIITADAANLKGVAPKVTLYAFKVLNAGGNGLMSDVIAAIERTVDPNDDGDPSDRLDVVNMSLGAQGGHPDDAASVAVDNAVRLGVTFCISAGNAGAPIPVQGKEDNYYYDGSESIGSPGTSRLAITVGAVNEFDQPAAFSSKGPTRMTFAVKPDVMAPGVDITSLAPSSGTTVLSGTSMAAPHVTGVAALLKSLNPSLTPADIKSAIVTTARDLSVNPMRQGAGRVDALSAATVTTFVDPTHLSFGLDDPAETVWETSDTITVFNRNTGGQTYTVFTPGMAGIVLGSSPTSFSLAPGDSQLVVLTLSVSNTSVLIVPDDIEIHGGHVLIRGTVDTLHVPWGFVRASRVVLTFDEPNPSFVGGSATGYFVSDYFGWMTKSRRLTPYSADVIGLPPGLYDIGVLYPADPGISRLIIREEVMIPEAGTTVNITSTESAHAVEFNGVDEVGGPLSSYPHALRGVLVHFPHGIWMNNVLPEGSAGVLVSPATTRVLFHGIQAVADYSGSRNLIIPQFDSWNGMSGTIALTNDPDAYVRQTMQIEIPPGHGLAKIFTELFVLQTIDGSSQGVGNLALVDTPSVTNGRVEFAAFIAPKAGSTFSLATSLHTVYRDIGSNSVDVAALYFTARNDTLFNALEMHQNRATFGSPHGDTLVINAAPSHLVYLPYHNTFGPGTIQFFTHARGPLGEFRYADLFEGTYAIANSAGDTIASGSLGAERSPTAVPEGIYTSLLKTSNHSVRGQRGTVQSVHRYDLTQFDPSPPVVTLLRVRDERGRLSHALRQGENAVLEFGFKVVGSQPGVPPPGQTTLHARVHGRQEWTEIQVNHVADLDQPGSFFSASLVQATAYDSVGIDLMLVSRDANGNSTDLQVLPAFAVGDWQGGTPLSAGPLPGWRPPSFVLYQNYPNPFNPSTTIRVDVPVDSKVTVRVYNMIGQMVATLIDEERPAGRYEIPWNARGLASGLYFCRAEAGGVSSTMKLMLLK